MSTETDFEALIEKLHHPRDWRVRKEAIIDLAEHKTTEAINAILTALYDESPHVVQAATHQLRGFGKDAIPGMLEALYSPADITSRRFIIHALDNIDDPDLIPHYIHFLGDSDPGMRYAAALALTKRPDKRALRPLLNALEQENAPQVQIIEALTAIGDSEAVPHIMRTRLLFDEDYVTCRYTAIALGRLKTSEGESVLLEASHHERTVVRQAAAEGLGLFNSDAGFERLVQMVTDENHQVRSMVVYGLGKTRREEAVPVLLSLFDQNDTMLRFALGDTGDLRVVMPLLRWFREDYDHNGEGLSRLSEIYWDYKVRQDEVLPDVLKAMHSANPRLQICAIWLFHYVSFRYDSSSKMQRIDFQVAHLDMFAALLSSENPDLRLAAIVCLSKEAVIRLGSALIDRLADDDLVIQEMAVKALAFVNSPESVAALISVVQGSNHQLGRHAIHSLTQLGGEQVVDVLIESLDHEDMWIRCSAAYSLGNLKSQRAVSSLIDRLRVETESEVNTSIVMGLGSIGDSTVISEIINMLEGEDSDNTLAISPVDAALFALMSNHSEEALTALYRVVNEGSRWQRRMYAVEAISRIGSEREVADRMFDLLGHEHETVRTTAAKELGYLGARTRDLDLRDYIVTNLINRLHDTGHGFHYSPTVAHMAAKSLYYVGTTEAIEALDKWSQEDDENNA